MAHQTHLACDFEMLYIIATKWSCASGKHSNIEQQFHLQKRKTNYFNMLCSTTKTEWEQRGENEWDPMSHQLSAHGLMDLRAKRINFCIRLKQKLTHQHSLSTHTVFGIRLLSYTNYEVGTTEKFKIYCWFCLVQYTHKHYISIWSHLTGWFS